MGTEREIMSAGYEINGPEAISFSHFRGKG
jgi:hypothetical protein